MILNRAKSRPITLVLWMASALLFIATVTTFSCGFGHFMHSSRTSSASSRDRPPRAGIAIEQRGIRFLKNFPRLRIAAVSDAAEQAGAGRVHGDCIMAGAVGCETDSPVGWVVG